MNQARSSNLMAITWCRCPRPANDGQTIESCVQCVSLRNKPVDMGLHRRKTTQQTRRRQGDKIDWHKCEMPI